MTSKYHKSIQLVKEIMSRLLSDYPRNILKIIEVVSAIALIIIFSSVKIVSADENEAIFISTKPSSEYILSENEDRIYTTLRNEGYSHEGSCGILGNIAVENPNFIPDLEANNGVTYGLFQWSDVGNRRSNLVSWCNNRLLYPNRIDGQLAFALYELNGGDPIACRVNDYLKHTDNPEKAAMEFAAGFERCIGSTSSAEKDGIYTGRIYPEYHDRTYQALSERINKANYYNDAYADAALSYGNIIEINIVPTAGIVGEWENKIEDAALKSVNIFVSKNSTAIKENPTKILLLILACTLFGYIMGSFYLIYFIWGRHNKKLVSNFRAVNRIYKHKDPATIQRIYRTGVVVLWDILKTYLAISLAFHFAGGVLRRDAILFAGLGIILGNDYPFWNKFKGGMGATVTMVTLCFYMPIWGPICCLIGLIIGLIARSLSLGVTIMTILTVPFAFFVRGWHAGVIVLIEMVMMIIKQRRFLLKYLENHAHLNS